MFRWYKNRRAAQHSASLGLVLFLVSFLIYSPLSPVVTGDPLPNNELQALNEYPNWVGSGGQCSESVTATSGVTSPTVSLPSNATEDQKIAQTFVVGFDAGTPQSAIEDIATKYHIGGVYLTGTHDAVSAGFTKAFFSTLNTDAGTPLMIASDEEGGQITRFTYPNISGGFPDAQTMGTMTDAQVEQLGQEVGQQLVSDGVTTDLAPVLDLDDGSSLTSFQGRTFSSDPSTVAEKAGAFAQGLQTSGIMSTFKHFPGFGGAGAFNANSGAGNTDTNPVTVPSSYSLQNNVQPYNTLLGKYPNAGVMLSNLIIPELTGAVPASVSPDAVNYLRKTLNFNGLITTDDLSALSKYGSQAESLPSAVSDALKAGVDMPLFGIASDQATAESQVQSAIDAVKASVSSSIIDSADTAVMAAKNSSNNSATASTSGGCCSGTALNGATNGIQAYNFLVGKGLSPAAAAGVVGNLTEESIGVDPTRPQIDPAYGYNGPTDVSSANLPQAALTDAKFGWGIAQWTPPGPKVIAYGQQQGVDPSTVDSLAFQLQYLWNDLSTSYQSMLSQLATAASPEDAATTFWNNYERGDPSPNRQAYARAYYELATNNTPLPPNVPVSATGGGTASGSCSSQASSSSSAYQNPLRDVKNLSAMRIDQGVDYSGDGPVYALGNGTVTYASSNTGWPGPGSTATNYTPGTYINYVLSDGPAAGKNVYVAEYCDNIQVSVGDKVTSSTVLCTMHSTFPFIETGWSDANPAVENAAAHPVYATEPDGTATAYGQNFSDFLKSLGAPPGIYQYPNQQGGNNLAGTLPSGWPSW